MQRVPASSLGHLVFVDIICYTIFARCVGTNVIVPLREIEKLHPTERHLARLLQRKLWGIVWPTRW